MERKNKVEFVDVNTGESFDYDGMLERAENEYDFDEFSYASELYDYFDIKVNGSIRYDVDFPYNLKQYKRLETMVI